MRVLFSVLLMTLCGSLGALFFKRGAAELDDLTDLRAVLRSTRLWLGGCFYLAGAGMNILLLRALPYSVVYPLTSLTYVWSLALSAFILHERVTARKLLGVGTVCLGVFLLMR